MATSPLFGWEEPDDTDLVKDGAAAIRTLGNAIDTSMGDLLGGTTGQVLSKASNTNMDFTWVTSDDANAIQNTIVDAKGDLIAASASDVPARLAVGANNTILTADSTAATGLKWATLGTYTSFSPVVTQSATVASTTTIGSYTEIGNFIHWYGRTSITATGTANNEISLSIPVNWDPGINPNLAGQVQFYDQSANQYYFCNALFSSTVYKIIFLPVNGNAVIPLGATGSSFTAAVASGDLLEFSIVYRKA
jgi:hypothetical protein